MPSYILLSLLAAWGFALSSVLQKFASKHRISNNWTLLVVSQLSIVPSLLLLPIFFPVSIPTTGWEYIFLYASAFFVGNIFFTRAVYKLDASTIAPFFQLQSVFVALLAFVFLKERFPVEQYWWIALMIAGAALVSIDERFSWRSFFSAGVLFILLQQVLHAASNIGGGFAVRYMNAYTFIFWGDMTAAVLSLLVVPFIGMKNLRVSFSQVKPLFLAGFCATVGATSLFRAFQTNVTISSVLALLTSPIVLFLSIIASVWKPDLLEHHSMKIYALRAVGVLTIFISAIMLSLSQ